MKVFYVSWNDLETVFHEIPWKKNFTVYPSLKKFVTKDEDLTINAKKWLLPYFILYKIRTVASEECFLML